SRKVEILDSDTNAIVFTNGSIKSESLDSIPNPNYSMIIWHISNNTGTFTIPFSTSSGTMIPLSMNVTTAGSMGGLFTFSSFPTNFRNKPLTSSPSINNMKIDNYNEMETDAVNRFWRIAPTAYTTLPIYKLGFTYDPVNDLCADTLCQSLIPENKLIAINWNATNFKWQLPYIHGLCDTTNNKFVTNNTQSNNSWWTLSNNTSYPYPNQEICLVTIDSTGNNNVVVWEKIQNVGIDGYKIYKESTVAGVYDSIGFMPFDSLSLFFDTTANPSAHRDKYHITVVDTLGAESPPSSDHTTMHLSITAGVGGKWNLFWTQYVGFNVATYKIWRGVNTTSMSLIDSVSGSTSTYTDNTPPSGGLYYFVEVVKPGAACIASKVNTNYNSSRSNVANNGIISQNVVADFSAAPLSGNSPLTVNFTDLSTGTVTTRLWQFGDGNSSTQINPTYTYFVSGTFSVKLIVSNNTSTDSLLKLNYITVTNPGVLNADFSASPTSGTVPLQVQFSDQTSGNPDTWYWDFGDGNSSSQQNPQYIYQGIGVFDVKLIVSNSAYTDSIIKTSFIQVNNTSVNSITNDFDAYIFPNPGYGVFTIQLNSVERHNLGIMVTNMFGAIVYKEIIKTIDEKCRIDLDLTFLPKGVYTIVIVNENIKLIRKVIIQ
ncbi:MAG: PKD domain-containing protein, partial [Bacteroidetes bacterium]|nr:PKD domain-containing protein [Bacteroidota bacterium]